MVKVIDSDNQEVTSKVSLNKNEYTTLSNSYATTDELNKVTEKLNEIDDGISVSVEALEKSIDETNRLMNSFRKHQAKINDLNEERNDILSEHIKIVGEKNDANYNKLNNLHDLNKEIILILEGRIKMILFSNIFLYIIFILHIILDKIAS